MPIARKIFEYFLEYMRETQNFCCNRGIILEAIESYPNNKEVHATERSWGHVISTKCIFEDSSFIVVFSRCTQDIVCCAFEFCDANKRTLKYIEF